MPTATTNINPDVGIRFRSVLTVLCAGWLMSGAVLTVQADEIYRWVDANGVVNYTQLKPRDVPVQALTTQAGAPTQIRDESAAAGGAQSGAPTAADDGLTPTQETMLEDLRAAEDARQAEIAKLKQMNCEKSRRVLSNLSTNNRIRIRDADGDERMMPEEERQRRISEAQRGIIENCSSA